MNSTSKQKRTNSSTRATFCTVHFIPFQRTQRGQINSTAAFPCIGERRVSWPSSPILPLIFAFLSVKLITKSGHPSSPACVITRCWCCFVPQARHNEVFPSPSPACHPSLTICFEDHGSICFQWVRFLVLCYWGLPGNLIIVFLFTFLCPRFPREVSCWFYTHTYILLFI